MDVCISHGTALGFLLRIRNPRMGSYRPSRARVVPAAAPSKEVAEDLLYRMGSELPGGTQSIDVLVARQAGRSKCSLVTSHVCSAQLPAGSFIPYELGRASIHLCSPELVFLQMACELSLLELIYVGSALCSGFRIDPWGSAGLTTREDPDEPLTNRRRIAAYLESTTGVRGHKKAVRALGYVVENARSPMEIGLALGIGLPTSLGGFALGDVSLNEPLRMYDGTDRLGNPRYVTRYPDILVSARDARGELRQVDVEYDAESTHAAAARLASDADRRNVITGGSNLPQFQALTEHSRSYTAYRMLMDRIRRRLGQRKKPHLPGSLESAENQAKLAKVEGAQFELWRRLISIDRLRL